MEFACCVELAGESPALVIAGEPGSRLPPSGEIPPVRRSVESSSVAVRSPGGKQSCGPSLKRTLQPREIRTRKGGVAEPVMSRRRQQTASGRSGGMQDAPGVWRRARSDSSARNRRGPTRRLTSSEGGAYKWNAKWRRGGRESEGRVVPSTPGESRDKGRGPALVVLAFGGKGEGMA
jgi:hypothetical protein